MIINYRVSSRGGCNRKHNHVIEAVRAVCLVCLVWDIFATLLKRDGGRFSVVLYSGFRRPSIEEGNEAPQTREWLPNWSGETHSKRITKKKRNNH